MIVTVTPNPSLDRTVEIPALVRGQITRASGSRVDPGGKGINVARALVANGHAACAVLPCGGAEGRELERLLVAAGLRTVGVPIAHSVRVNLSLVEPDGTVTKINEPGPTLEATELAALELAVAGAATGADWLAACGSLPPGAPVTMYADLVRSGHDAGVRVAIDSSGPALAACLEAGPDLVKPNRAELTEVTGRVLHDLGDVVAACHELLDRGAGAVLASLGGDGAVLTAPGLLLHANAAVAAPRSTVGAGDALLAGYLAHALQPATAALTAAVAWGAGAVTLPGTRMPGPRDLDPAAVTVLQDIANDRPLRVGGDSAA